ncbi:hypothetical protein NSU18_18735 [Paenibacillus sp. FSL H8-0048]|uniref:hypothetical protein n=1 Tax=Paenibacillus sp. FSL H8-0048 TaxID=2954508 RepID=UPI0030F51AE2
MKKIITRTINRPPAGAYSGLIYDWDILDGSAPDASETEGILMLKVKFQIGKQHITTEKQTLLLWDIGDPMYNLCSQFDVLPEIGEDFDCQCFVGRTAEIIVEEEEREGRIYSTIANLRPLQCPVNVELLIRTNEQERQQSAAPSMVEEIVENSVTAIVQPSPMIKKVPKSRGIAPPNRPRKPTGPVPPESHPWSNM